MTTNRNLKNELMIVLPEAFKLLEFFIASLVPLRVSYEQITYGSTFFINLTTNSFKCYCRCDDDHARKLIFGFLDTFGLLLVFLYFGIMFAKKCFVRNS